jgi:hypothetical protein
MKILKTFIAIILFALSASAQADLPVIKSNSDLVTIQDGENLKKDGWRLSPEARPDVYEAELPDGKPHKVTFTTDVESISFDVEVGRKYDFIIQKGDALCYTQIVGTRYVPAAVFDEKYRAARTGKTFIEIPDG